MFSSENICISIKKRGCFDFFFLLFTFLQLLGYWFKVVYILAHKQCGYLLLTCFGSSLIFPLSSRTCYFICECTFIIISFTWHILSLKLYGKFNCIFIKLIIQGFYLNFSTPFNYAPKRLVFLFNVQVMSWVATSVSVKASFKIELLVQKCSFLFEFSY